MEPLLFSLPTQREKSAFEKCISVPEMPVCSSSSAAFLTLPHHKGMEMCPLIHFSSPLDKSRRQIYLKPWFPNLVKCHALHMKLALLFPVSYSLRTKHARSISTRKHLSVSVSSRGANKLRWIDGAPGTQPRDADRHVGAHCYSSHHQIHSLPLSKSHRSFTGTVSQYVCAPFAYIQ